MTDAPRSRPSGSAPSVLLDMLKHLEHLPDMIIIQIGGGLVKDYHADLRREPRVDSEAERDRKHGLLAAGKAARRYV